MELSRRDVLKLGVLGSAALLLPIERVARTKSAAAGALDPNIVTSLKYKQALPVAAPISPTASFGEFDFYEMRMQERAVDILGSNLPATKVWGYNGITPGPTISVRQGRQLIVRQINDMKGVKHPTLGYEPVTSVHLHGSASLPEYDGYASDVTKPGEFKDYHYPNIQDSRTLWYHDHGVHQTASNAYMGLAAQYHLHDNVEDELIAAGKLPNAAYDIPLTVRDAIFGTNGQLIFNDNSESSVMGDVILTNGKPWPVMQVEPRVYRFRILNGAVSRSFKFALTSSATRYSAELPMTVVATDGGLMPAAQTVTSFRHGMAERYEILIDFRNYAGKSLYLKNLGNPNNVEFENTKDVMRFDVTLPKSGLPDVTTTNGTPLNPNKDIMGLTAASAKTTRRLELVRTNGSWTVNGKTWVDVINSDYGSPLANPGAGDVEIWEIKNGSGGWFHPFHIHLVDFRILDRNGRAPFAYEQGPKDVVYVGENETVRVVMPFRGPNNDATKALEAKYGPRTGRYMAHCHNLVHEDHDMMGQFWVGGPASGRGDLSTFPDMHHPIEAAKARSWSESLSGAPDLDNFKGF